MKLKFALLTSALALTLASQAQEATPSASPAATPSPSSTPLTEALALPQVKAGECTALVVTPAKFEPRTEQVVIKEEAQTIEIIPAEYEWVEEQVEVKPAVKRLEVVPAVLKTVEEEVVTEPESLSKEVIPPQYNEVSEEITTKPAYRTIRSEGGARTFSTTGEALRLDEIPAEVNTISKQVVASKASVKDSTVPPKTTIVKKQVVEKPAEVVEIEEPAEFQTVKVKKLVTPAREEQKIIPAEYAEVTVFEKVADAEVRWENVLCNDTKNGNTIEAVQKALQAKGYKIGSIDGTMGKATLRAIEKYQKDHNLGVGGLTKETLDSLGIEQ